MKTPKKKISTPVLGLDLYPTILDLAGIEADPGIELDGISLLALLKGDDIASRNLYWHYPHYGNQGGEPSSILLKEHWKLIHYWEDGRDELYNLQTDIGEKNNLSSQEQERVSSMRTILYSWLDSTNATYPKIDSLYDELKEQKVLEANGKTVLHRWEKLRKEMLKSDWMPNEDWWGSEVYMD
jgi:arylsulfatase A-like enzyme